MIQVNIDAPEKLLALAAAMEREAAKRYRELAETMRAAGNAAVAEVFEGLAAEERSHESQIEAWARRDLCCGLPKGLFEWQTGEVFALAEEDLEYPEALTVYRALSIAVHNEERAFAFYSYVAANSESPQVRQYAEGLAREELSHAAMLRQHRRAAYHRERQTAPRTRWRLAGQRPQRHRELAGIAAALEAGLARTHRSLAERLGGADPEGARLLSDLAAEEGDIAGRLGLDGEPLAPAAAPQDLRACLQDLEEAYDFYMRTAERARDEAALALAQELAESTIGRIARIRSHLSDRAA